jgi:putative membrane protein
MSWKGLAAAAITMFAIPVFAQDGGASDGGGGKAKAAARDSERGPVLLAFIHHANQREIELAKLAKERSDSPQVKALADRLMTDHQAADDRILAFAKGRGLDLEAVRAEVRSKAEELQHERQVRAVGSATGEWIFAAEPVVDQEAVRLAMAQYSSSLEDMRTLTGAALARAFVQAVIKDHQMVIDRVTHARSGITDPEVANLVDSLLPSWKQHVTMAQSLEDRLSKR